MAEEILEVTDEVAEDIESPVTVDDKDKSLHNPLFYVPFGITDFQEVDDFEAARDASATIRERVTLLPDLIDNIMFDEDIPDKGKQIAFVGQQLGQFINRQLEDINKMVTNPKKETGIRKVLSKFNINLPSFVKEADIQETDEEAKKPPQEGLMLWKEDDGTFRFLAIYSNNYLDVEDEIISAKSHEDFVLGVENGDYPLPTLRHFHIPGTDWGQSEFVHYDKETGFAIAAGFILPGHESEAEAIMEMDNIALSHGMTKESVEYDPDDPRVIVKHQTVEISDLTFESAANKLTSFQIIKELEDMSLPQEKKDFLKDVGYSEDAIASLDEKLKDGSALATSLGLDSKETDEEVADEKKIENADAEGTVVADAVEETEDAVSDDAPTFNEKQTGELAAVLTLLTENIVKQVGELVDAKLAPVLEELDNERAEKDELLGQTPRGSGSLMDMVLNPQALKALAVDQSKSAVVDERTSLFRNSGPDETEEPSILKGVPQSIQDILSDDPFGQKANQKA